MSEFDFLNKSRKLLRELNWYLLHIAVYLIANVLLVLFIFGNTAGRWPLFFFILLWAIVLIYHGLRINDKQSLKGGKKAALLMGLFRLGGY